MNCFFFSSRAETQRRKELRFKGFLSVSASLRENQKTLFIITYIVSKFYIYSFSEIYLQHFDSAKCDGHAERSRSTCNLIYEKL